MHQFYTYIALDLAHQRETEAREARFAAEFAVGSPQRPSLIRRGLAEGLAAISRGTAAAARRLDAGPADDLGRSLSPTE
jgi:hypothetical protein